MSFAPWTSLQAVRAWKANPEMRERLAKVLEHVTDFHSEELDMVASATRVDGAVSLVSHSK